MANSVKGQTRIALLALSDDRDAVAPNHAVPRAVNVVHMSRARRFLFDSGGGMTFIDREFAEEIGCQPFGRYSAFRSSGQRLDFQRCGRLNLVIGNAELEHSEVGVLELGDLLPSSWPRIDGVLSLESFRDKALTLNLKCGTLTIETSESLSNRVDKSKRIRIRESRQASGASLDLMVAIRSERGDLWFLLDSGCLEKDFLIAPHAAKELGIDLNLRGVQHLDADGHHPERWIVPRTSIDVRGVGEIEGRASVWDMIYDGVICSSIIERWDLSIDLRHTQAWVRRAAPCESP